MGSTLLLIDDSKTIRTAVEWTFARTGIRVETAVDGAAGVALARQARPDVVLVDLFLKEESGYDVCRQVRAAVPGVPVLLLAGRQRPRDEAAARACGAAGFYDKPFLTKDLIARVEELATAPPELEPAIEPEPVPVAAAVPEPEPPPADDLFEVAEPEETIEVVPEPVTVRRRPSAARPPVVAPDGEEALYIEVEERVMAHPSSAGTPEAEAIRSAVRDVVQEMLREELERVVWEVVPDLAERVIREEIKRLTKD